MKSLKKFTISRKTLEWRESLDSPIDRLLLGDNTFIGVDHLSQERSRTRGMKFDSRRIAGVIDSALTSGAEGLVCSTHPNMERALSYMREEGYSRDFGIYLIVPDAQSYVRLASEKGVLGLFSEVFRKLSFKERAKVVVRGGISALTSDPAQMLKNYLDAEVSIFAKSIPKNAKIKSVILHELLTELIISFKIKGLAREYIDYVKCSLNSMPGFVTRNFARFVDFLPQTNFSMRDVVVLTPFNKVGFQMNPSREACEKSLSEVGDSRIIAMSILAAGYLSLDQATEYLKQLPRKVSCVAGVSTESHAKKTFSYLQEQL